MWQKRQTSLWYCLYTEKEKTYFLHWCKPWTSMNQSKISLFFERSCRWSGCVAQSQSCCYTFTLSTSSIPLSIYSLSMPLQLRLSSCPLASLSFYIPVSFPPSIRLSLAVSGDGCLCLLHLIWHFLHYCDQTDGKAIPKATGLLCRWLKAVLVAEVDFTFKLQATRDWCIQHSAAD